MSLDTPIEVEIEFDRLLAQRSGAERINMACQMFEQARIVTISAIRMARPEISHAELRLALFDRFYGGDSGEEQSWMRRQLAAASGLRAGL